MSKKVRAVVLSGGGAKGSYQIGAWKALREIGYKPDIVTGTSAGALNGALMALDRYDVAIEVWDTLNASNVFSQFTELSDEESRSFEYYMPKVLKEALLEGGADYTPFQKFVKERMDEDALRKSPIRFGLVTTEFPTIQAKELFIEDIPVGKAADFVLASAACFPVMKSYKIDDKRYIDGGFSDNLPIQMALDAGADDIVVVNISNLPQQSLSDNNAVFRYIHNKRPFNNGQKGSTLVFDKDFLNQNFQQGYLDTLKAFGKLDGDYYSFYNGEKYRAKKYEKLCAEKFNTVFSNLPTVSKYERSGKESVINFLNKFGDNPFLLTSNYINCAETAAEIFEISPRKIYSLPSLGDEITELIYDELLNEKSEDLRSLSKSLDKGLSFELLAHRLTGWNKKQLTVYSMQLLLNEPYAEQDKSRLWRIAEDFPDVFCASIYCWSLLKSQNK